MPKVRGACLLWALLLPVVAAIQKSSGRLSALPRPKQVAEASISVYNVYILKSYSLSARTVLLSLVIGLVLGIASVMGPANAQSPLQGAGSGLQQQTAPGQNSINTQKQTGTLQNNNGGAVLNQGGSRPLGVVSSPNQAEPEIVATPSNTLKTEVGQEESSNGLLIVLAIISLAIALLGVYFLRRKPGGEPEALSWPDGNATRTDSRATHIEVASEPVTEKPLVRPEPMPVKPRKKSLTRRQRRKNKKSN